MIALDRRRTAHKVGRVGELLAAYILERNGVQVANVNRDEHDFWIRTPTGRLLTVQVKTASMSKNEIYRFYAGNVTANTDIVALVALQPEVVLIYPGDQMRQRCPVDQFTAEHMAASIKEHLQ